MEIISRLQAFHRSTVQDLKIYYLKEEPRMEFYKTNDSEGKYFSYLHVVGGEDKETIEFEIEQEAK